MRFLGIVVASWLVCCGVFVVWIILFKGSHQNIGDTLVMIGLFMGLPYLVSVLLVYTPILLAANKWLRAEHGRWWYGSLGAALFPVPSVLVAMLFRDGEDPATVWGWIRHWSNNPEEIIGFAPFAVAGAFFGYALAHTYLENSTNADRKSIPA